MARKKAYDTESEEDDGNDYQLEDGEADPFDDSDEEMEMDHDGKYL